MVAKYDATTHLVGLNTGHVGITLSQSCLRRQTYQARIEYSRGLWPGPKMCSEND